MDTVMNSVLSEDIFMDTLQDLRNRVQCHSMAHIEYTNINKIIGIPIVVCSAFLTSSMGLSITGSNSTYAGTMAGFTMSLLLSVLISADKYYRLSEKANQHNMSANLLKDLVRDLEMIATEYDRHKRTTKFNKVLSQLSVVEKYEEPISDRIRRKVSNKNSNTTRIMPIMVPTPRMYPTSLQDTKEKNIVTYLGMTTDRPILIDRINENADNDITNVIPVNIHSVPQKNVSGGVSDSTS